jgi:HSP20 family molecular chaperone IbpA
MFKKKLSLLLLPVVATLSLQAADPFNDPFFNDPFGDDIFKEMMQMQKEMDKMFERMHERMQQRTSGLVSPLGTYKMAVRNQLEDKGDHYELVTSIPESKENHIDINTANGMMSITAKIVEEQENKNANMVSQSRSVRMYQQSMTLPADADENSIQTAYKNGKLVVSIAKKKGLKSTVPASKTVPAKSDKEEKKSKDQKESNSTMKKMTLHTDVHEMS